MTLVSTTTKKPVTRKKPATTKKPVKTASRAAKREREATNRGGGGDGGEDTLSFPTSVELAAYIKRLNTQWVKMDVDTKKGSNTYPSDEFTLKFEPEISFMVKDRASEVAKKWLEMYNIIKRIYILLNDAYSFDKIYKGINSHYHKELFDNCASDILLLLSKYGKHASTHDKDASTYDKDFDKYEELEAVALGHPFFELIRIYQGNLLDLIQKKKHSFEHL